MQNWLRDIKFDLNYNILSKVANMLMRTQTYHFSFDAVAKYLRLRICKTISRILQTHRPTMQPTTLTQNNRDRDRDRER